MLARWHHIFPIALMLPLLCWLAYSCEQANHHYSKGFDMTTLPGDTQQRDRSTTRNTHDTRIHIAREARVERKLQARAQREVARLFDDSQIGPFVSWPHLRFRLKQHDITLEELALYSGIGAWMLQQWALHHRLPSLTHRYRVAVAIHALGLDDGTVLYGADPLVNYGPPPEFLVPKMAMPTREKGVNTPTTAVLPVDVIPLPGDSDEPTGA